MASKPSIPKGTRDFSPAEVAKRQYIIATIKSNFEKFGFQPIETPSFENSETLMGKYGEEGDRLIFKILNSGEYLSSFNYLIKAYLKAIYINVLIELSKRINEDDENIADKKLNIIMKSLLNRKFIQTIVDGVNKKNSEFELYNFYSASLSKSIELEINSLRKSEYIKSVFFKEILTECSDCAIDESKKFKDFVDKLSTDTFGRWFGSISSKYLTNQLSEKALRYDLTVPFARYVVQHQSEIEFPFKRYQIQPVWRADRPQKGRFREFFQCDADVVGSKSLWQEVELVQLYDSVFTQLGLEGVTIKINNRKILSGIAEVIGAKDKLIDFTVALDKLDKIGEDGVKKEMIEKGIGESAIEKVQPLFNFTGSISEKIEKLSALLAESEEGMKGVEELRFICDNVTNLGLNKAVLDLDVTLARGLNYYTGAIFEVAAPKTVQMGSIGGGGRYDDLTSIFGLPNVSGVGISFGLDRIYLVLEELGLFPETVNKNIDVLFINFGDKEALFCLKAINKLRAAGVNTELYPDADKMKKQMNHANKRAIPFVVLVGEEEVTSNTFTLKNMVSGEQFKVSFDEMLQHLK